MSIFLLFLAPAVALDACDVDASPAAVLQAVNNATTEADFTTCAAASEEACICAALRLGWRSSTQRLLNDRMLRKVPAPAVRRYAQERRDSSIAILARIHQKYPKHLKMLPALEWAQSEDALFVRVRYARYTRGEPLVINTEVLALEWDDAKCSIRAEGDEKPLYISSTLQWRHYLRRRDDCADSEEECARWADEGACKQDELYHAATRDDGCTDVEPMCAHWARGGECDKNVAYMSASCPLSCMTCRNAPSLHERCRRSCSQCPRASGRTGVDAAWLAVPGGVVFEARKQVSGHWERLLAEKHPPNRIDAANGGVVVGAILECFEACAAAKPEPCAADDATSAACEEHCRAHCAAKLAEGYAVR